MLALLTTLALAATTGLQDAKPQDPPAKAQPKIATTAHILRALRTQIETARLEFNELGKPQAALTRCEKLVLDLYVPTTQSGSIEERAECLRLLSEVLELRSSILESKAKSLGVKSSARGGAKSVFLGRDERLARSARRLQQTNPGTSDIDAEIERNALAGHTDFVLEIGERAVPGLLRALAKTPDQDFKNPKDDPLYMLMMVDPFAADTYVGTVGAGSEMSVYWEVRFARSIEAANPFAIEGAWDTDEAGGTHTRLQRLATMCDSFLDHPGVTARISKAVAPLASNGAFTPGMTALIAQDIEAGPTWRPHVRQWLRGTEPNEQVRGLLLKGLLSSNPEVSRRCSRTLRKRNRTDGVLNTVLKGNVALRSQGFQWLVATYEGKNLKNENVSWNPPIGPDAAAFVDQLLQDPSPEVRNSTLKGLKELSSRSADAVVPGWSEYGVPDVRLPRRVLLPALSPTTLVLLAKDEQVDATDVAEAGKWLPEEGKAALALALVAADEPGQRGHALPIFAELDWHGGPQRCIDAVRSAGLSASELNELISTTPARESIGTALHTPEGESAMARWAIETENAALLQLVCFQNISPNRPRYQLAELPADIWAELLAKAVGTAKEHRLRNVRDSDLRALARVRRDDEAQRARCAYAASADDLSVDVLYALLNWVPPTDEHAATPGILRLVKSIKADRSSIDLKTMLSWYSYAFREDLSSQVVTAQGITPWQLNNLFGHAGSRMTATPEVINYAIKHSATSPEIGNIIFLVLQRMATQPEHADIPWISRLIQGEHHVARALKVVGRLRHPDLLAAIGTVIRGPAIDAETYDLATRTLTVYLSDEAAELLLVAARKVGAGETRDACLAHLEAIAALQDAENRWATRRVNQATREVTVSKLLGLLDQEDATVRVESIRALATWEAVEALPRLIELLKDADPKIKAAARAALDRINSQQ